MKNVAHELNAIVAEAYERLAAVSEAASATPPAPGKWSRKEIIGHLIDSASNNHQRFVRVQQTDGLALPGYEQEHWVAAQNYRHEAWADLLAFWRGYNLHLAHVIAAIPADKLEHRCSIDGDEPVTLRFIAEDYVQHLQHHLGQMVD